MQRSVREITPTLSGVRDITQAGVVAADRHKYIQAGIRDIFSQGAVAIRNLELDRKFISGLVLGAGASSRFGQPKQLLPFRGGTLIGWVINQAERATGLDEVVVVLGRAVDEIRETVVFGNAKVVENPVFGSGCASSYRAGIGALDPRSDAIMILLGDQPGVDPETINRVADEWRRGDGQIALASYRGREGHPMLFARPLFDELVGLHGDKAAWKLVDANPDLVRVVTFDRPFPEDINTMEDFQRATSNDARQM